MKKILTYLFLIVAIQVNATNYYVSTTGNDANPGTLAEPYLTIQYGINQLRAGDTLFIKGGGVSHHSTAQYISI